MVKFRRSESIISFDFVCLLVTVDVKELCFLLRLTEVSSFLCQLTKKSFRLKNGAVLLLGVGVYFFGGFAKNF